MTRCEGPCAPVGHTCKCPHPELNTKSCQGDIWLCSKCESARFDIDMTSKSDNLEKSENATDICHDAEKGNLQNNIMKINSIIFTKSSKSYPNWPGKILNIHPNNNTCLIEFFYTKNWMLVPISNLQKFDNIESFKKEASKTKFRHEFECALKEANTYMEKMQLLLSSKKHLDKNDKTGIKHNEETSGVSKLYPDLNIQCLTHVPDTDIINETTRNQESHVSTGQTAS